jgi:hypothetical protein
MADIEQEITIAAPLGKVWESWDRFGEIARFNKGLRASSLLPGSPASGKGARRRCDLKNGKSFLLEELADYHVRETMEIVVFDSNLPVRTVRLRLCFFAPDVNTTRVTASVDFTMKFGILGRLMKIPARKEFNGDISRLLGYNKAFNEAA